MRQIKLHILEKDELAKRIDHAVLRPHDTESTLKEAIRELESHGLRCLIVSPTLAAPARTLTKRCVGAVAGFPHGYSPLQAKLKEIESLAGLGVDEIDYVMNTQRLLNGDKDGYAAEAKAVSELCTNYGITCKLIIETPLLNEPPLIEEAVNTLLPAINSEYVRYIKTSTGFAPRPTYPEDIVAIRQAIETRSERVGIKAAGGIRTALQALFYISLGADIIGTSSPSNVLQGLDTLKKMKL